MIQKVLRKMFGSKNERDLKLYQPLVEQVNSLAENYTGLSDEEQARLDALLAETEKDS